VLPSTFQFNAFNNVIFLQNDRLIRAQWELVAVVSERKKGKCMKELVVQFSLSNSLDETKR
jgi:hypothetical protein